MKKIVVLYNADVTVISNLKVAVIKEFILVCSKYLNMHACFLVTKNPVINLSD